MSSDIETPNSELIELKSKLKVPLIVRFKKLLPGPYYLLIPGVPTLVCGTLISAEQGYVLDAMILFFTPFIFVISYLTTAGVLSRPHQANIKAGVFPRSSNDSVYIDRKLYSICLTAIFYFTPLYSVILYVPWLQRYYFRLFGYKGNLDFTIRPDTWVRDLPLLSIGKGAYIANQSTLGTNIIYPDDRIRVDTIEIGAGAIIGAMSSLAPGSKIGDHAEVGIRSVIGVKAVVGENSIVGPECAIGHGVRIGKNVVIGQKSEIDVRVRIEDNEKVPAFSRYLQDNVKERA